jgi:predicted enzyme related to lactoylglutathione lyase
MSGLGDYPAAAVLRAENLERAKKFYTEVLGLTMREMPGAGAAVMLIAGQGSMITIYERPGMPAPQNTTLGWGVSNDAFDAVIADLRSKGVVFEEYDIPEIGLKTVDGIAEMGGSKSAWFLDTEDNILNIVSM